MNSISCSVEGGFGTSCDSGSLVDVVEDTFAYASGRGVFVCQMGPGAIVSNRRYFYASPAPNQTQKTIDIRPRMSSLSALDRFVQAHPANGSLGFSCLTISPDRRLLAVADTGYNCRVFIFSLEEDSSEYPLYAVYGHRSGVQQLAFSPDSTRLCSLGTKRDRTLNVWDFSRGQPTLQSSVTNTGSVNGVCWHSSTRLFTYGQRHAKIWNVGQSRLVDKSIICLTNLVSASLIDEGLMTLDENGQLSYIDIESRQPQLTLIMDIPDFPYQTLVDSEQRLFFVSSHGIHLMDSEDSPPVNVLLGEDVRGCWKSLYGIVFLQGKRLYLLRSHGKPQLLADSFKYKVCGGKRCSSGGVLLWTESGEIGSLEEGRLVPVKLPQELEITAADLSSDGTLAVGTYNGTVRFFENTIESACFASSGCTVSDTILFDYEGHSFCASARKDGSVTLFEQERGGWKQISAVKAYPRPVFKLTFCEGMLISASTDGSISIHAITSGVLTQATLQPRKILKLGSTPLDFHVSDATLYVSTQDRRVLAYDLDSFSLISNHRLQISAKQLRATHIYVQDELLYAVTQDWMVVVYNATNLTPVLSFPTPSQRCVGIIPTETGCCVIFEDGALWWNVISEDETLDGSLSDESITVLPDTPNVLERMLADTPPTTLSEFSDNYRSPLKDKGTRRNTTPVSSTINQLRHLQRAIISGNPDCTNEKELTTLLEELKRTEKLLKGGKKSYNDEDKENRLQPTFYIQRS